MAKYKRRIKLIQPHLQLKLTGWFLSLTVIAMLLQYMLFGYFLTQLAMELPGQGGYLMARADTMLLKALGFSFALVLPLTLAVGILITFRVAGPVYRFEQHLQSLARGEEIGPCRIRKGDELQELCRRINAAVDALRGRANRGPAGTSASEGSVQESPAPALPNQASGQAQRLA